jgi:hypothetical protein
MLERSTLSFWMGYAAAEVAPVVARLREMMLTSRGSSPTRPSCRCSIQVAGGPSRAISGRWHVTIAHGAAASRPQWFTATRLGGDIPNANTLLRRGAVAPQVKAGGDALRGVPSDLSGAVTRHPVGIPSDRHPAEAAARADTGDESAWHARFSASQDRDAEAAKVVRGPRPGSLCRAAAQCRLVIAVG